MKKLNKKSAIILLTAILMLSMIVATRPTLGQVYPPTGTHIPTYARINVAPNPVGVGQTVNVNFFLATPLETSERPVNMTVREVDPSGKVTTLGPFTGDTTGGTYYNFVPPTAGNYTFQFIYLGQVLAGTPGPNSWAGLINDPSQSEVVTLIVQQEPITHTSYPFTPLPTSWWQTPVSAMNVQNWYAIMGPWLGYGANSFATTGAYNCSSYQNPYTSDVLSGHILWTKPWAAGGVAGGIAGGTEDTGHYWSTSQYQPKYAPVIINGRIYSQTFDTNMGTNMGQGIQCVDLYTGNTIWTINTTNTLRCGMVVQYKQVNQYGCLGPFIWTTGTLPPGDTGGTIPANAAGLTQWNMYDAFTGHYLLSIVNGSALTIGTDDQGDMIGYFINNTAGTEMVHPQAGQNVISTQTGPHLTAVNMTVAIGQTGGSWQPALNTVQEMKTGYMYDVAVPTNISGVPFSPAALYINCLTNNAVVMTAGFVHGQGVGGETAGWLVLCDFDQYTGTQLFLKNITYTQTDALLPYTRVTGYNAIGQGMIVITNDVNNVEAAFDVRTGVKLWEQTNTGLNGAKVNNYDQFSYRQFFTSDAIYLEGLGGDIWCRNLDGTLRWYTNTTALVGDPGIETPYGVWPLWTFASSCLSPGVGYFAVGHEYDPPLFHGAQLIAVNTTNGKLLWSELDTSVTSTAIAYGILVSLNAYDNQLYAMGKGPSSITVSAPSVGVTTETPITITGKITDVSAGAQQQLVKSNFPNGLPCVSEQSQSHFMEAVYQQQAMPADITGVPITLSVLDANNNYRTIGTTTSDALGTFGYTWTPDIPGGYKVYASFAGSNSYYASSASTLIYAGTPASTSTPTATTATSVADTYFVPAIAGLFVLIIIVLALVVIMMLRKRP
ncbi:MAG: hypothetical protein ABSA79_06565 [Candidatus Bathyarchaeia archaeon]|jgi:hypothetical protein